MATMVGDRFVQIDGVWRDVVTGAAVRMSVGRAPADRVARARNGVAHW